MKLLQKFISDYIAPPQPVPVRPELREFLIWLGDGRDADLVEQHHRRLLNECLRAKLAVYDYGSPLDDGWYRMTRLARVSLAATGAATR